MFYWVDAVANRRGSLETKDRHEAQRLVNARNEAAGHSESTLPTFLISNISVVNAQPIVLPPHSPNLHAHLERWNRSVKEECLSKIIWFGEASFRHVLSNYVHHFHGERNHQGKGHVILFAAAADRIGESSGEIRTHQRLGG